MLMIEISKVDVTRAMVKNTQNTHIRITNQEYKTSHVVQMWMGYLPKIEKRQEERIGVPNGEHRLFRCKWLSSDEEILIMETGYVESQTHHIELG